MKYTKEQLKEMKIYLVDKLIDSYKLDGIYLLERISLFEERIEANLEDIDINIELLIEDIIRLFAYKRSLKFKQQILENKYGGE